MKGTKTTTTLHYNVSKFILQIYLIHVKDIITHIILISVDDM